MTSWKGGVVVVAFVATACGPVIANVRYEAAPQFYPAECKEEPWKIEGTVADETHDGVPKVRELSVTINGDPVLEGAISAGEDASGEISGTHKGKKISAICSSKPRPSDNYYEVRCAVMIDNTRTVTLTF
jgi:hypothetical protein